MVQGKCEMATTMDKIFETVVIFILNTALQENFNFYFLAIFC